MTPDPWSLLPTQGAGLCSESKELLAFDIPHEVVLIPARARRTGIPGAGRPVLGIAKGERIREDESLWCDDRVVLTTNRFPFFEQQGILWPVQGHPREPSVPFLTRCLEIADESDASLLLNSIGASASIPLCHMHLCPQKSKALPLVAMQVLAERDGASCLGSDPSGSYPCLLVAVRAADALQRARMIVDLLTLRLTPAYNLVAQDDCVWFIPRLSETVQEYSSYALGAAELFGRFVLPDAESFAAMDERRIEGALNAACVVTTAEELCGVREAFLRGPLPV